MVEIVFSDSACGSLKLAQHFGEGEYSGGCIGVVISHEDGSAPTQAEQEEALRRAEVQARNAWETGSPLGGNPEDVLSFALHWSIGDISEQTPGPVRQPALIRQYKFAAGDMETETKAVLDQAQAALAVMRERSSKGEELRVWYSDTPDELCGFYWLMAQLETLGEACGPVYAVKLPRYEPGEDETLVTHSGWGEIGPGEWSRYLPLAKPVPPLLRRGCAWRWKQLQQENAPLRGLLNGRLVSLPADAYDSFIRREIAAEAPEFEEPMVIGRVLNRELGIGDALIAERIEVMVQAGELEALSQPPEDGAYYWRRLRRTEQFPPSAGTFV